MIRKSFSNIGIIEYKIASSRHEYEQALHLVYKEYLRHGYILPKYYKSELRLTLQNALPETTVFIGLLEQKVVTAVTLMPDSPLSLPMDQKYKSETDILRCQGRKICEVGQLAVDGKLFGHGLFSLFNFNKLSFILTLFKLLFQHAHYERKLDDLCIVTDPKSLLFQFLPFEEMGPVKYYGFDRIAVKKKAAVAKRLDLRRSSEFVMKRIALKAMFLDGRIPAADLKANHEKSKDDFYHFFFQRSDIFKDASLLEKQYLRDRYSLDKRAIQLMLDGKWKTAKEIP